MIGADINDIPPHWKWVTLDNISKKITDGSHNPPKGVNFGIPMLSARNIHNNRIDFSDVRYLSDQDFEIENQRTNLEPFDILLTTVGTIGRTALVPPQSKFVLQRSVTVIKPLINPKYLLYYFQSSCFQKELIDNSTGTAQKGIYLNILKKLKIPLAPINEQNRIVEVLETNLDTLHNIKKELNEQLKLIPAYKQLNIDKFVLNNGNKSVLKDVANLIDYRGKTPKKTKKGIRLITAKNVKKGYVSFEPEEFISEDDYDNWMTRGIPKKGDVFITTEAPLGNVAQYNFNEKIALAQRIITIHPSNKLDCTYLKYYLLSSDFQRTLLQNSTGTTVKGIKSEVLKKMIIYYPEINIQNEIVEELDNIIELANKLQNDLIENFNKIEILEKKILEEAFQGKLVNQMDLDISIDISLENIQKEKEQYLLNQQEIMKNRPKIKRMEKEKLSIIKVLEKNKKPISAKQLWEDSMYSDSIEKFYSELKKIQDRIIEEKTEKGSLISLK